MSTLLLSLARENPWPGLALASAEPGRGSVSRGPELAAGRHDIVACRAARVRRRAVLDHAKGTSARERGAVSRTSVLSMRARGSVDTQAPVRGYFLWVGGALLVLLFAANSLLPATPPSRLIEFAFYASADPDRLRAEETGSSCHRYQPARFPAHSPGQGDCSPLAAQLGCGRCCTTAVRVIVRAIRCE